MKRNIRYQALFVFLLLTATKLPSQTVNYKILEDNPYYSNLQINLLPFYVDDAGHNNLSLGYAFQANLTVKILLTLNFYLERPYTTGMDWGYHFATVGIFASPTVNQIVHFTHLELGGTYHFKESIKVKGRRVTLKSHSDGKYTYTTSINVPASILAVTGLRAGIYSYKTALPSRQYGTVVGDLGGKGVISSDGTHFGGAANLNASGVKEDPFFDTESSTNMRVLGIYAGISTTHTRRVIIDAEEYGRRGNEVSSNFYADLIIAPVRIDDFIDAKGKTYKLSGGQSKGFETRPFGLRAGYEYSFAKKHVGFYAKTEVGIIPGLSRSHFYCMLTYGLSIHGRIKALAAEK
jgi:hypothetical protein